MTARFINLADVTDPNDPSGRTYREVNAARGHAFPIGALVEMENGARLFVVMPTRDCDQSPLYSLSDDPEADERDWLHGYGETGLVLVREPKQ